MKDHAMKINEFISATELSKRTAATLSALEKGDTENSPKLIILKNNSPKAVLLSIEAYGAMEEELEDLRLTALALARLQTFDPDSGAIPHDQIMERFGK
jgi:antitoxin StbD